jgi:hypothetical protein
MLEEHGLPVAWGWDFARAQDWTVGIALDAQYRVCRFARWQAVPWEVTYERVVKATGDTPAWGDSTGVGDAVVETLQRRGCPITSVTFTGSSRPQHMGAVTAGVKQKLMERLASVIQQTGVGIPDGPIRAELETFGYEYGRNGVRYSCPAGLHDDCVMALALAVYGRDQFGEMDLPALVHKKADRDIHPGFDLKQGHREPRFRESEQRVKSYLPGAGSKRRL